MNRQRYALRKVLSKKQDVIPVWPGIMGLPDGTVDVPGRPNYVYVQIIGMGAMEVYDTRVTTSAGLPVMVGYDSVQPGLLQVLSVRAVGSGEAVAIQNGAHHGSHEYPKGNDIVWVQLRQFMPWRVTPSGLTIFVHRGVGWINGGWKEVAPTAAVSLTSLVPTTAGLACYVLVTIDTAGTVVTTKGTEIAIASLTTGNIPAAPSGTEYILAAIRLYSYQTSIDEAETSLDVIDLRFPMRHRHTTADLPSTMAPSAHAASHQNGGADQLSVAGLSGVLANRQDADKIQGKAIATTSPTDGQYLKWVDADSKWEPAAITGAGTGDVTGPASATTGHMAVFADTTGKVIEDGGAPGGGSGSVPPAIKVLMNHNFR